MTKVMIMNHTKELLSEKPDEFILYLEEEKDKSEPFLNRNHFELAKKMLPYIGEKDPVIRDDVIYVCLAHVTDYLTSKEIQTLAKIYIGEDYLFYDIKNEYPNSVLRRTFTLLQLAVVVYFHHEKDVLNKTIISDIVDALAKYLKEEKILQGYDDNVGWMHALAHSADVVGQLLRCKEVDQEMQEQLLDMLVYKVQVNHYTYVDLEDERIVGAIKKGLDCGNLSISMVEEFVKKLAQFEKQENVKYSFTIHSNVKSVLRSLYFGLYDDDKYDDLRDVVVDALKMVKKRK